MTLHFVGWEGPAFVSLLGPYYLPRNCLETEEKQSQTLLAWCVSLVVMLRRIYRVFSEIKILFFSYFDQFLFSKHLIFDNMHFDSRKISFNFEISNHVQIATFFCKLASLTSLYHEGRLFEEHLVPTMYSRLCWSLNRLKHYISSLSFFQTFWTLYYVCIVLLSD